MKKLTISIQANEKAMKAIVAGIKKYYKDNAKETLDEAGFGDFSDLDEFGIDDFKVGAHVKFIGAEAKATIELETTEEK